MHRKNERKKVIGLRSVQNNCCIRQFVPLIIMNINLQILNALKMHITVSTIQSKRKKNEFKNK